MIQTLEPWFWFFFLKRFFVICDAFDVSFPLFGFSITGYIERLVCYFLGLDHPILPAETLFDPT